MCIYQKCNLHIYWTLLKPNDPYNGVPMKLLFEIIDDSDIYVTWRNSTNFVGAP